MKVVLIVLAIILAVPIAAYFVSSITRKNSLRSLQKETDFLRLLHTELNGWSGICKSDSYMFVLSRLQHLGLMSNDEKEESLFYYKRMGAGIGISVKPQKYSDVSVISFRFENNELLSSIGFALYSPNSGAEALFPVFRTRISELLGTPSRQSSTEVLWKNLSLTLLDSMSGEKHLWLVLNLK